MTTTANKTRVFIWGSCVSRDTFEYLPAEKFELLRYVARQSALSAVSPPVTAVEPPSLASAFQQRMVSGDFASDLLPALRGVGADVDLLLVDLTDERLGVYELPDGTVLTRSYEFLKANGQDLLPADAKHLAFGRPSHRTRWTTAFRALAPQIRQAAPTAQVVLLDLAWAARTEGGGATRPSFGVSARQANRVYPTYMVAAADALGAEVISVPPAQAVGADDHPWGEAPFHYAEGVYRAVVESLLRGLPTKRRPAPASLASPAGTRSPDPRAP